MSEYERGDRHGGAAPAAPKGSGELRLRRAEALSRIPGQVRYDSPLEETLSSLAARIVEHTEAVAASLVLLNDSDLSKIGIGVCNLPEGYAEGMLEARNLYPEAAETFRQAVATGRSWIFRDAPDYLRSRPEYQHMLPIIDRVPYRTLVATPFRTRPETMGVVYLYYSGNIDVDADEVEFARAIAEQAAPVMDNAWLFEEAQRRQRELEALAKADQALHESILLEDVYQALINLAVDLLGADRSLFLTFNEQGLFHAAATRGVDEDQLASLQEIYRTIPRERFAAQSRELGIVEDLDNEPRLTPGVRQHTTSRSSVDVPVFVGDEFFGMFVLGYREKRAFSDYDKRLLRTLAVRAGLAIQNALLYGQARQRSGELEALRRADEALHTSLQLADVEQAMVDLARELLSADSSLVVTWDQAGRLSVKATRGVGTEQRARIDARYQRVTKDSFSDGKRPARMALIGDVTAHPAIAPDLISTDPPTSLAEIPVFVAGELWGFFCIGWNAPRAFTEADRRMFDAFSARASLAIQNALQFTAAQQRMAEFEALYQADAALHRSLKLDDVLEAMVDLAVNLLKADSSLVATTGEDDQLTIVAHRGIPPQLLDVITTIYKEFDRDHFARMPRPIPTALVEDVANDERMDPRLRSQTMGSYVEIPVLAGGQPWGVFSIGWSTPRKFSDDDLHMFDAFSARASLAIQNALLFEQAQHSASMEERQRIARELHDSVSQALYGIGLGARTARRRLGAAAAADVLEPVDYIVQLAESGLAETRALIFELVPDSLEQQGLVLALQRQAAATQARYRIEISAYLCDEPELPIRSKEALYRIAQESLHNMAKHAQATRASLTLATEPGAVTLVVADNGVGFDTSGEFPGHLGLRSMEERATRIGGTYRIHSRAGEGTTVSISVPVE